MKSQGILLFMICGNPVTFLYPKFSTSSHLKFLYISVCVRPVWKTHCWFPCVMAHLEIFFYRVKKTLCAIEQPLQHVIDYRVSTRTVILYLTTIKTIRIVLQTVLQVQTVNRKLTRRCSQIFKQGKCQTRMI